MSSLIYEFELSNFMKNHSIIFVIHLKQVKKNSFERTIFTISSSLTENDEEVFVIKRILKKRILNDTKKFLIKWNELTWKSKNTMTKNVSKIIKKFRQKKKLHDFKSNATKFYSLIAKNRVNIVFLLTYFIFFVYSDYHSRSFFYISTFSLSSSILSKLDIIRLLNSLIFFISLHNLEISNTFRLTKYLFILSITLIIKWRIAERSESQKMN
jgi:hypothetical protein